MTKAKSLNPSLMNGFRYLVGGTVTGISRDEDKLNLVILHPEKAGNLKAGFEQFFIVLKPCREFGLTMSRNTAAQVTQTDEILNMEPLIQGVTESLHGQVLVLCSIGEQGPTCYLRVRAGEMMVYDEEMDRVDTQPTPSR